ncbi:MAG TPA: SBBP repeat-containing protein [Bacteroidia bacterium]|nr:SBBP repeat-containing protein [Bacteroidia bacterium]
MKTIRKVFCTGLLIFSMFYGSIAQSLQWAKSMGGIADSYSRSLALDAASNSFSAGYFTGSCDFDPGVNTYNLTSNGVYDICISSYNSFGDFRWAHKIGSSQSDQAYAITTDANGNVYVCGYFSSTVDFNPDSASTWWLNSSGNFDAYIIKMDNNGNLIWAKKIGGPSDDVANDVYVDQNGSVFVTGYYTATCDFDPDSASTFNITAQGSFDVFVCKLDINGNFVWAKSMGGSGNDEALSIDGDNVGNIYVGGYFYATADFDPGSNTFNLISNGLSDIFSVKLNQNGNFDWAKSAGGSALDQVNAIKVDALGDVYCAGNFDNTIDFDPGNPTFNLISNGGFDCFVWKLNTAGNFLWAKQYGGPSSDHANEMVLDNMGNVYVAGQFGLTVDFNPGGGTYNLSVAGVVDSYVTKLSTTGNFVWAYAQGGTATDRSYGLAIDAAGYVHNSGDFDGPADFDPGSGVFTMNTVNNDDIFITKMSQPLSGINDTSSPFFSVYPIPASHQFNIATNESIQWVELFSIDGKRIHAGKEMRIDCRSMDNGIYLLTLVSIKGEKANRLIQIQK